MGQANQQKEIAAALKKKNAEASEKAELDNLAALAAEADRRVAAEAGKKMESRAIAKALSASKAALGTASSLCKGANKCNNHCSDSEDAATVETQGKQKNLIVGPPVLTNTSASTTFDAVIKVI